MRIHHRRIFLSYESLKSRKRRIFFPTSYIQGHVRGSCGVHQGWSVATRRGREKEEKKKTKEGGLSPQEGDVRKKEKKKTKEGEKVAPRKQGSVCPQPRISFLVHDYLGSERPISVEVSAPTRLSLRGSYVQRKFRQWTTLHSKSSTLKGLLYAPIKQEQYHKRITLRRLKSCCKLFVARKAALLPWSEA